MTNKPQITVHTSLQLIVETDDGPISLTSQADTVPERWHMMNPKHEYLGHVAMDQRFSSVYVNGLIVFQEAASESPIRLGRDERRLRTLVFVAKNIYKFRKELEEELG